MDWACTGSSTLSLNLRPVAAPVLYVYGVVFGFSAVWASLLVCHGCAWLCEGASLLWLAGVITGSLLHLAVSVCGYWG